MQLPLKTATSTQHKKINTIMKMKVYHNILVQHGIPCALNPIGLGFIYQQDNDPIIQASGNS